VSTLIEQVALWGIVASLVSVVLGVVAIGLSMYLYNSSRSAERGAAATLAEIRAQTEILGKITDRQLARLTKAVTERPRLGDIAPQLAAALAEQPRIETEIDIHQYEQLGDAMLSVSIGTYYYTGLANIVLQEDIPDFDSFDLENKTHVTIKNLVDESARDFRTVVRESRHRQLQKARGQL
jgi:hypothetical protein